MTDTRPAAELHRLRAGVPVLLVTGFADRAEVAASGLPVLAKPFGRNTLAAAVEGCLGGREPAADAAGKALQPSRSTCSLIIAKVQPSRRLPPPAVRKDNERFLCGRSNRCFDPRKTQDKPLRL